MSVLDSIVSIPDSFIMSLNGKNIHSLSSLETAARETLEQVMAEALSKSGSIRSSVRAVCLAVSGVNHPTDQQRILDWLRYSFF